MQNILLIEDNPGDARLIEEMVSEINSAPGAGSSRFKVEWQKNLGDGLKRLSEPGIDLVLLDLSLPDSQGIDTFAKTQIDATRIPVILLTGLNDEQLAMVAVRSGAQDYLQKNGLTGFYLAKAMRYALERKAAEEEIRQLSQKILQAREEERSALAHEMHDGLGQSLLALKLQLESRCAKIGKQHGINLSEEVTDIISYLDEILQEVRTISHNLSPIGLKGLGLTQAIKQLVHKFNLADGPKVTADLEPVDNFFPENWDMNVYRIVEQALVNAIKHAGAKKIHITGRSQAQGISFSIQDDGNGMDVNSILPGKTTNPGLGLRLMRERARILGGNLQIRSARESGTEILLELKKNA
jgi:signal transduction histidine kinase